MTKKELKDLYSLLSNFDREYVEPGSLDIDEALDYLPDIIKDKKDE